MTPSRFPPTLETLAPELLDKVLKHLLEDAEEVEYLGRGSWIHAAVLDFFHLSRTSARLRSQFWTAFLAQTTLEVVSIRPTQGVAQPCARSWTQYQESSVLYDKVLHQCRSQQRQQASEVQF